MTIHINGGNYSRIGVIQRNEDGDMLVCPSCGSSHIIKAGTDGTQHQRKRFRCKTCGKKTQNPKIQTPKE